MRLGNDIVDISAAMGQHPRFAQRILSEEEYQRIKADDESLLWVYWAAKEAAYKAVCQRGRIAFSPSAWEVSAELSRVRFADETLFLRVERGGDCVFAEVTDGNFAKVVHAQTVFLVAPDPATERAEVRRLALALGQDQLGLGEETLQIRFEEGRPYLWVESQSLRLPLSFTHHGRYAACSLLLPS